MQQKHLKHWLMTTALIGIVGLQLPVQAKTQADPIERGVQSQSQSGASISSTVEQGKGIVDQATELFGDVKNFIAGIPDFLSNLPQELQSMLGGKGSVGEFGVPDFGEFTQRIESGKTFQNASTRVAEFLENGRWDSSSSGSFAIRQDAANNAARQVAEGTMSAATLSKDAQQQMSDRADVAAQMTQRNQQLAQKSQDTDVTQHIMQNLSEQTALNAQVNQQLLQEAQQGRVDRAINNMLSAQIAESVDSANIADRRQMSATNNLLVHQSGSMMLPGGFYIGAEEAGLKRKK